MSRWVAKRYASTPGVGWMPPRICLPRRDPEEELRIQLRDLSCFFCVREPRLSPAEVRAILDDARTTGLHPPGDALSADDWAQLTQELEEDYSVGSFEAEVEANPLPAGQQYVLDVFDRMP